MNAFEKAFSVVIGEEGRYGDEPSDPGNWTGGRCGAGECRGTNFGISAASYPTLNIRALTEAQARELYLRDYWERTRCDRLPPPLALLVFDAAVNNGPERAVRWLQAVLGTPPDGAIGPLTLAALEGWAGRGAALCSEFQARRTVFMASLPTWRAFGLGWARRLSSLPYHAMQMEQ